MQDPAVTRDSPDEDPSEPRGARAMAALAAILVAAWLASALALDSSPGFWTWMRTNARGFDASVARAEAALALRREHPPRAVVLGSSIANANLDLRALVADSHWRPRDVHALWFPGATTVELAMFAREVAALEPDVAVVLTTIQVLYDEDPWSDLRWYDARMALEVGGAASVASEHTLHADLVLASLHPIARHREQLRLALVEPLLAATRAGRFENPELAAADNRARREQRYEAARDELHCPSLEVEALVALSRRLVAAGTRVVVVESPTRLPEANFVPVRYEFRRCLEDAARRGGFLFLPRPDLPAVRREHFADTIHFGDEGRRIFTEIVREELAREGVLPGVLPGGDGRPSGEGRSGVPGPGAR